jgi:hypothetical protein
LRDEALTDKEGGLRKADSLGPPSAQIQGVEVGTTVVVDGIEPRMMTIPVSRSLLTSHHEKIVSYAAGVG